MLGRLIGATATSIIARQIGGVAAGPAGAALGIALPFVARRLGPMGMAAMAVGAWAVTRLMKEAAEREAGVTVDAVQTTSGRSPVTS
jgi:hypothetical protein